MFSSTTKKQKQRRRSFSDCPPPYFALEDSLDSYTSMSGKSPMKKTKADKTWDEEGPIVQRTRFEFSPEGRFDPISALEDHY